MTADQSTRATLELPPEPATLEAVVDHFTAQYRLGLRPTIELYEQRYPQYQVQLRDLLSSVAMIEGLKQQVAGSATRDTRAAAPLNIEQLGDYRIVRELGRGGMGIVLEAIHQSLGRRVAVKVLPAHLADDPRAVERFRLEAQAASRLHHTHIVTVFGVGFSQGHHYYVMEFVDGWSVSEIIRSLRPASREAADSTDKAAGPTDRPDPSLAPPLGDPTALADPADLTDATHPDLSSQAAPGEAEENKALFWRDLHDPRQRIRWALRAMVGIADAADYARRQGVLHRDLKPSNLLADAEGRVRLTDFGLVKHLDAPGMTKTGDILGTPQYMPPEAAEGRYDQRSEVYGLGLTLYEMLTLHPTFPNTSSSGWALQLLRRRPEPLRSKLPQAWPDLERVVNKALAAAPEDRYPDPGAFRDDLRCLVEDRAVSVRRPWPHEELQRWARRNPTSAVLAGSCLFLLVLVALSTTIGYTMTQTAFRDLAKQHDELRWQQEQTESARRLAVESQQRITAEHQRAEANLQVSMDAIDAMFVQIISQGRISTAADPVARSLSLDLDGLNEMAGVQTAITAADAQFLQDMLKFYHQIAEQNADSLELKLQSGRAYRRVANSYHLIGDWNQAVQAYRQAAQLYREIVEQDPTSEHALLSLAQVDNEAGQAVRRSGDFANAVRHHRRAIETLQQSHLADQPAVRLEVARSLNLLCTTETGIVGDLQRVPTSMAEDYFGTRDDRRPARENFNRRRPDRRNEAATARNLGFLEEAIRIADELLQASPADPQVRLVRAKSYRGKAVLLEPGHEPEERQRLMSEAIGDLRHLRTQYPADPHYAYSLALTYTIPLVLEDAAAVDYLSQAGEITKTLCSEYPQNIEFHQLNANIHVELAKLLFDRQLDDEGIECLYSAASSLSHLVQTAPRLRYYRLEHGNVTLALALKLKEKNMQRRAIGVLERAIEEATAAEEREPMRNRSRTVIARQYQLLTELYQAANNRAGLQRANRELRRYRAPSPRSEVGQR